MLIATEDPKHFIMIANMVDKIKDFGYGPKEFKIWFLRNFNPKTVKVWVEIIDDEVKSFVVAQLVKPLLETEVFIPLAYVDPNSNGLARDIWERVDGYARYKKAKKISIYTKSRVRAFTKKYGLKLAFYCLSKEVKL